MRTICVAMLAVASAAWVGSTLQGSPIRAMLAGLRQWDKLLSAPRCFVGTATRQPPETVAVRWSTAPDANATRILTREQMIDGKLNEIEAVIKRSFSLRTGKNDASLPQDIHTQVTRVATPAACAIDGVNSICFDQADMAFTPGVLTITRVVTADGAGIPMGGGVVSAQAGQVLDADIYFNPSNSPWAFATPAVLAQDPRAFDLEAVLVHEWRSALAFRAPASAEEVACSPLALTLSGSIASPLPQR